MAEKSTFNMIIIVADIVQTRFLNYQLNSGQLSVHLYSTAHKTRFSEDVSNIHLDYRCINYYTNLHILVN